MRKQKVNKTAMDVVKHIFNICLYYIPALIFMWLYSTIPSIPFVRIDSCAYIFVAILFVAGILLTLKQVWGSLIGIVGCIFAVVGSWFFTGVLEMRVLIICSILCIFYIYCMISIKE